MSVRLGAKTGGEGHKKGENPEVQESREVCEEPVQWLLPPVMAMGRISVLRDKSQGSGMSPEPALGEAAPLLHHWGSTQHGALPGGG